MRSSAKYIFWIIAITFVGGFLLVETSGLLGRAAVTPGTAVGSVDGRDITFAEWQAAIQNAVQQEQARLGRGLTADEQQRVEDEAFESLINDVLLARELERRGIAVTEEEIRQAAQSSPPPQLMQSPELQTEGRFDMEKYRRFLASPAARQQGILVALEQYYRREIPRLKLFDRIANGVYLSDARLWRIWQDQNDSAQVSYVAFSADTIADSVVTASDAELRAYFDQHRSEFVRQGRAVVSLLALPRVVTAADSAASRARAVALRQEILGGAAFDQVAQRESSDSVSAAQGGSLGRGTLESMNFVPEFSAGVRGLAAGEISEPVLTPFGYHLIKVDERQGDTLALRHILVPITQSDSSAVRTDREADRLAGVLANSEGATQFDSVARAARLEVSRHVVTQGDVLVAGQRYVPDVSAWAFSGARVGETSDLVSAEDAYYIARLDTLTRGGEQRLEDVRDEVRAQVLRRKKVERLTPVAQQLAQAAAGSTLEAAAQQRSHVVNQTPMFVRVSGVPGLGVANRAIGAAFGLPVGAVSQPVPTEESVVVLRVNRRVAADSSAWAAQKEVQRTQLTQAIRQQRVQQFLAGLRQSADVEDKRDEVRAATRGVDVEG
jgi:peptidyl-prolyl cis-trans isomerase D